MKRVLWVLGTLFLGLLGVFVGSVAVYGLVGWSLAAGVLVWTPVLLWLTLRLARTSADPQDLLVRGLRIRRPRGGFEALRAVAVAAGTVLLMLVVGSVLAALGIEAGDAVSPVERKAAQGLDGWLAVAYGAVLVAPLVEETGFRGFIQRRLEILLPPALAIGLTALVFGLSHGAAGRPLVLIAVILGIVTGVLAWRTDSVLPGVVVHAAWNGTLVAADGMARIGLPGGRAAGFGAAMDEPAMSVLFLLLAVPLMTFGLRVQLPDREL